MLLTKGVIVLNASGSGNDSQTLLASLSRRPKTRTFTGISKRSNSVGSINMTKPAHGGRATCWVLGGTGMNTYAPSVVQRAEHLHVHCHISLDYLICVAKLWQWYPHLFYSWGNHFKDFMWFAQAHTTSSIVVGSGDGPSETGRARGEVGGSWLKDPTCPSLLYEN